MALGGGSFGVGNKILPGSYINFVSAKNINNAFGERGVAAIIAPLDYLNGDGIVELTKEKFMKESLKILGYECGHERLMRIRDFFKHGKKLYLCAGVELKKASCKYGTTVSGGSRANKIRITLANIAPGTKLVRTYMEDILVDSQTVATPAELVDNDYIIWNRSAAFIPQNEQVTMRDGKNDEYIEVSASLARLGELEDYNFNILAIDGEDDEISLPTVEYTKRMRDEVGKKFQTIIFTEYGYNMEFNYEGIINFTRGSAHDGFADHAGATFWLAGAMAGCSINSSLTNMLYDGEVTLAERPYGYNDAELLINQGMIDFHKVDGEYRIISDITSFIRTTSEKGEDFKSNQTIRVLDQIAMDIATIFNKGYIGRVQNDDAGRGALWADIVRHHEKLAALRAIENFDENDVIIEKGETKNSVIVYDAITPVNAMSQLYMKVSVE